MLSFSLRMLLQRVYRHFHDVVEERREDTARLVSEDVESTAQERGNKELLNRMKEEIQTLERQRIMANEEYKSGTDQIAMIRSEILTTKGEIAKVTILKTPQYTQYPCTTSPRQHPLTNSFPAASFPPPFSFLLLLLLLPLTSFLFPSNSPSPLPLEKVELPSTKDEDSLTEERNKQEKLFEAAKRDLEVAKDRLAEMQVQEQELKAATDQLLKRQDSIRIALGNQAVPTEVNYRN